MAEDSRRRRYDCRRVPRPIVVDGSLNDPGWSGLHWTDDFVDITGNPALRPRFRTRVKLGWDDAFLYVGAKLEEPHVWGTIRRRNAVIFEDNDFELFLDPEGDGLSAQTAAAADARVRIPMAPGADSVNVATAAAIAMQRIYAASR